MKKQYSDSMEVVFPIWQEELQKKQYLRMQELEAARLQADLRREAAKQIFEQEQKMLHLLAQKV